MNYSKYTYMRSIVFYDLPSVSKEEMKISNIFRNELIKLGYFQIQESVYSKVIQNKQLVDQAIKKLKKIVPKNGKVRAIVITEKQYESMYILCGEYNDNELINDTNRYKKI